jgi:CHAD domain-containing protein
MPKAAARTPDPTPNAARVVAAAIRLQWRRARDELTRAVHQGDGAEVHDLRVALRRLLAALELAAALDLPPPHKMVRRLARLLTALSPLRDLEVEKKTLERLSERVPVLADAAVELERRRAVLAEAVTRKLAHFEHDETERSLEAVAHLLEREVDAKQVRRLLALGAVAGCYAKFDRRRRALEGADHDAVHRARIAFKQYRYAVEVTLPLLPPGAERGLAAMKHFQDELGAIQDASVLIRTLARFAPFRRRKGEPEARALLASLEREQELRVHRILAAFKAQVAADPPAFSEIFG